MRSNKKKSRHLFVFCSYSLVLHFTAVGFLFFIIEPQISELEIPVVSVQLVDMTVAPLSSLTRHPERSRESSPVEQTRTLSPSQGENPFHSAPPTDPNLSLHSSESRFAQRTNHIHFATYTLIPKTIYSQATTFTRTSNTSSVTHQVLLDKKAGQRLSTHQPPKILHNPTPSYPQLARKLGWQGKTLLRVEVLDDGTPGKVKIQKSCGHLVLDHAAAEAIKDWKFTPAQDGYFAIRSVVDLPIRFTLQS